MKYKAICILALALNVTGAARSQQVESNPKQELHFVFEVKQIDEFIDRFNNVESSLFNSYLAVKYPGISRDRNSMLKSLFNKPGQLPDTEMIDSFCKQVSDSINPVFLDFYNQDWYAEATCRFYHRGAPRDIVLLLKIQQTTNGGSKWMIMGAVSPDLASTIPPMAFPDKQDCCKFLNPMSHATNFISLSRAFSDKKSIPDYLDSNFLNFPSSKSFMREFLADRLKYQYVREIRYHFLQVDGWIFTVSQYRREGVHSGWLISTLDQADSNTRNHYLEKLLLK